MLKHLLLLACSCFGLVVHAQQPNILYIMSDDHDADAISAYNKTFISTPNIDRIAKEGVLFTKSFVGNSICAPMRATLLTGQHSHISGIIDNLNAFDSSRLTFPKLLQQAGYETAVIGKWHLKSLPSGFNYWKILPGQGLYYDPRLIHSNNDTIKYVGYATDVITNEALQWLRTRNKSKPFALLLHHKAPHRYFLPPVKYIEQFARKKFPEPPTLYVDYSRKGTAWKTQKMSILRDMQLCSDLKVDPDYIRNISHLRVDSNEVRYYNAIMRGIAEPIRNRIKELYSGRGKVLLERKPVGKELLSLKYQWYMQDFMACVASLDENVGKVLKYLDSTGETANTVVIYTSDQGFFLGENGWFDKRFMYDVSMQNPLLIRWPNKIKPRDIISEQVQNIDYAPTILDMAGVAIPDSMQGVSLKALLLGQQKSLPRTGLYYHYYEYPIDHAVLPHLGIRTPSFKLIYFYTVNEWELYDLQKDKHEQNNLIRSPKHQAIIKELKKQLIELRKKYKDHEPAGELK